MASTVDCETTCRLEKEEEAQKARSGKRAKTELAREPIEYSRVSRACCEFAGMADELPMSWLTRRICFMTSN